MSDITDVVGIDLGTTNTVVARAGVVLPQADGTTSIPSVVAFPPNGAVIVGHEARRRRPIDPENTIMSSKRLIGRDESIAVDEFRKRYPQKISIEGGLAFQTRAGRKTPEAIATVVLERALAGSGLVAKDTRAIVAVPAEFGRGQKVATLAAARASGLRDVQLLDEPVATAVAHFGYEHSGWAAVYDLGGGTFDFAIIDARKWPYRVVAHGGDLFLGGDDFDTAFARFAGAELIRLYGWDVTNEVTAFDRLVAEAERAKIRLSTSETTEFDLAQVDPETPIASAKLPVTRAQLSVCVNDLIRRTFISCDAVLAATKVDARQIDDVLLAGGTTLIPAVADAVAAYFNKAPRHEVSPMDAVALGAARHPWRTFG